MTVRSCFAAAALALGAWTVPAAHAVIILGGDGREESNLPSPNIYVGQVDVGAGTTFSPRHVATAAHLFPGDALGQSIGFVFNDGGALPQTYQMTVVAVENDLAILQLDAGQPSFVNYAPVWRTGSEIGKSLVTIGRGTMRGDPVLLDGQLRGWEWGDPDGQRSWGTNVVDDVIDDDFYGPLLAFAFDSDGGPTEAIISANDSGGPVFIQDPLDGNVWKLAGVNFGVDTPFAYEPDGPYFNAALFDMRGFYFGDPDENFQIPDTAFEFPASSYATAISGHLGVIDAALASVPEPGSVTLLAIAAAGTMLGRRRRR